MPDKPLEGRQGEEYNLKEEVSDTNVKDWNWEVKPSSELEAAGIEAVDGIGTSRGR